MLILHLCNNILIIIFTALLSQQRMEPDLSHKQQYLYKEIIEGGYNPEQFQEFLDAENPDAGMNLELWTMASLKSATEKFKGVMNNASTNEGPVSQTTEQTSTSQQQISSPVKGKSESIMYGTKHENYSKKIKCVQSKLTPFYNTEISLFIDGYEKKEGGVFEKSYYAYKVKYSTPKGLSNAVDRRYSDFEWLRETLMILHPNIPIPLLAKKGKMRRTEEKHLMKRMYILQKFLNKIVLIPDIRADHLFELFLTIDSKALEKEKSKYKKIKSIPIEKIETVNGEVDLMLSEASNTFISRNQKYVTITQPEVKKIYKDFKGAATMLENCSAYLKKIGTNCHALSVNLNQFKKQCFIQTHQNNLFLVLEEITSRYSDLLAEQAKTFRKQIYSLIKYQSYEMLNLIESFDKLAGMQQSYIDQKMGLLRKKEKLFEEGNINKWGIAEKMPPNISKEETFDYMLPKETKELTKLRDVYAFANAQIYNECYRILTTNDVYLSQYLRQIIKIESDVGSRSIMIWADVLAMVSGNNK